MTQVDHEAECRGCQVSVRVPEHAVQEMLRRNGLPPDTPTADGHEYARRLAACANCPHFAYGTTCRICGCLVAFRARLADKHCPAPDGARW